MTTLSRHDYLCDTNLIAQHGRESGKVKRIMLALLIGIGVFGTVYPAIAEEISSDDEKAIAELVAAADAGNVEAQYVLGNALINLTGNVAMVARGVTYLEQAVKQGHVFATHNLANLIRHGGVPGKTATDAFNLFLISAEAGFAGSQNNLGDMYETGDGVPRSYGDAIHWYTRSAMQGEPTAYMSLGTCYAKGLGVSRNVVESYRWRLLAVKHFKNAPNNRSETEREMKELEKTMTPQQIAEGLKLADKFVPLKQTKNTIGDPQRDK